MDAKAHWENIYQTKDAQQVSWYQAQPHTSLALIRRAGLQPADPIVDVGGGASTLVDHLLAEGFAAVTVLDIAAAALDVARQRLGARAQAVTWREADVTEATLPPQAYALWHDRAVFHFLGRPEDRQRYMAQLQQALRPDGWVIMATFAPDGPNRCSGLDVTRYSAADLQTELGPAFELIEERPEAHLTPSGGEQKFLFSLWRRR